MVLERRVGGPWSATARARRRNEHRDRSRVPVPPEDAEARKVGVKNRCRGAGLAIDGTDGRLDRGVLVLARPGEVSRREHDGGAVVGPCQAALGQMLVGREAHASDLHRTEDRVEKTELARSLGCRAPERDVAAIRTGKGERDAIDPVGELNSRLVDQRDAAHRARLRGGQPAVARVGSESGREGKSRGRGSGENAAARRLRCRERQPHGVDAARGGDGKEQHGSTYRDRAPAHSGDSTVPQKPRATET